MQPLEDGQPGAHEITLGSVRLAVSCLRTLPVVTLVPAAGGHTRRTLNSTTTKGNAMIVKDLMTTDPVSVHVHTKVKAALALLDENDITTLPVVGPDGRLCGVVSEADLIRELVDRDPRLMIPPGEHSIDRPRCVGDVMSTHAITVHEETDLAVAVELATSTAVKTLPVVDEHDRLVGILSRRDVVRMLARSDDLLEQEVDALLVSAGMQNCLVDVQDGVAEITGATDHHERILATVLARAVAGVVEVHVD